MVLISGIEKRAIAFEIISSELAEKIVSSEMHSILPKCQFIFRNGVILFIRYNDFNEYSYHLQYSNKKNDRERYDNYDKEWSVKTKPNHLHPRYQKISIESPMTGDPNYDIPKLISLLQSRI